MSRCFVGCLAISLLLLVPAIANAQPKPRDQMNQQEKDAHDAEKALAATAVTGVAGIGICGMISIIMACLVGALIGIVPIAIAIYRSHPDTMAIALITVFFGWSCFGWWIALIWAVKSIQEKSDVNVTVNNPTRKRRSRRRDDDDD